jgi:MoaA/NifB/PqqE/SkfB family radical SAM enzyme
MRRRVALQLDTVCDNRCEFCAQAGLSVALPDVEAALAHARTDANEVTFVGGEPTLHADLAEWIACARSLGFTAVGVQTHARALADAGVVERLHAAGLTDVHVSVHAATAAAHDYHVGVEGSFVAVKAALAHLRARGITVIATTVLTRSNMRVLAELPAFLAGQGVAAWCIEVALAAGRAATGFDRVIPRLSLAIPFALHALDRARKLGLPSAIAGAPSCLLGPFAARRSTPPRAFAEPCERCAARDSCAGIDPLYVARWGDAELRPLAHEVAIDPLPDALARMFVGIGPLAQHTPPLPISPAAARHALPVLGKVTPALDEVRGKAQPDAAGLREIFPALFESPDDDNP